MVSEDWEDVLRRHDAILMGACGHPSVPDHLSLWELILPIRQRLDLWANIRPARLLEGVPGPLAGQHQRRRRHGLRAREHRGRVLRLRRARARGAAPRGRRRDRRLHAARLRARHPPRVRARRDPPRRADVGDQEQRLPLRLRPLGRGGGRGAGRLPRRPLRARAGRRALRAHGAQPREPGRRRRLEPLRRHPHRPRGRAAGRHGHGGERQRRTGPARHARPVRARPRLRAGHRRAGHRQPAPAPCGARACCCATTGSPRRPTACSRALEHVAANGPRTRDLGGSATTREVGDAIVAALSA